MTYDTTLESESQGRCAVSKLDRAAGVGVVIGHSAEEGSRLNSRKKKTIISIIFTIVNVESFELRSRIVEGIDVQAHQAGHRTRSHPIGAEIRNSRLKQLDRNSRCRQEAC